MKVTYLQKSAKVNRNMKHGDVSKVSKATGFTTGYVSFVISGKYVNESIMDEAYKIAKNRNRSTVK